MSSEQRLGAKTFWLFVLSKSGLSFILLLIIVTLGFFGGYLSSNWANIINYLTGGALFLFMISLILNFFLSWLTYINYTFSLDDNGFKMRHGILNKEETAIPYRQIQSVDIRQDLLGQIVGYSRLVILTAGHDEKDREGEAEAEFPPLDSALAKNLQSELLKRSETQRVIVQK